MTTPLRILASAVVALVAAIGIASAWAQLDAQTNGAIAAPLDLQRAQTLQRQADAACLRTQPCAVDDASNFARQILAAAPASALPFSYVAIAKARSGDGAGAEIAAQEALRRTPRATLAHAIMADQAGLRSDMAARLFHIDRLLELRSPDQQALVNAIADLAMTREGLALVGRRIEDQPFWAESVLNILIERQIDPILLLSVAQGFPKAQDRLLSDLLSRRGPQAAFLGWLEATPPAITQDLTWPIDPTFTKIDARRPFNWAILSEGAEYEQSGGLYASYSGRGRERIVEQLVMLGPGRYTLATDMTGRLELRSGVFGWSVACVPSNTEIGLLPIETLTQVPTTFSTTVTVPATGCAAQRLTLWGLPGEFPRRARGTVKSVTLTPETAPVSPTAPSGAANPSGQAPRPAAPEQPKSALPKAGLMEAGAAESGAAESGPSKASGLDPGPSPATPSQAEQPRVSSQRATSPASAPNTQGVAQTSNQTTPSTDSDGPPK